MTNEELIEEVKRYYSENFEYLSSDQPTLSILTSIARHFAEWGAEHKQKDEQFPPLEGLDAIKAKYYDDGFKNGFDEGVDEGKRLMMEDAVEADVNIYRDLAAGKSWAEFVVEKPPKNLGDKVRIIIVKEDEK
jgi:hypothetical protein